MHPSSSRQKVAQDAADVIQAASDIARTFNQVAQSLPYVGAVAGVLQQISEIMAEMKSNRERCQKLYERIFSRSKLIIQWVERIASASNPKLHNRLKEELKKQQRGLEELLETLRPWSTSNKISAKFTRFVKRKDFSDSLDDCAKSMDDLIHVFMADLLVDLSINVTELPSTSTSPAPIPQALPAKPNFVVGRDSEIDEIVNAILRDHHVAILGMGGIGKTTIARSVLHHDKIRLRYNTARYFIYCEPTPTKDLLLRAIADALGMHATEQENQLLDRIVHRVSADQPVFICFDNFETAWDDPGSRGTINDILTCLVAVPALAIIITMRGTQCPAEQDIEWTKRVLQPMTNDNALAIFHKIVRRKPIDLARKFVEELDGIPLAITLMSRLLDDDDEDYDSQLEELWTLWNERNIGVLENGGTDRLSRLDVSIGLSVHGPRMDETSRSLLHLLSYLPDGLHAGFKITLPGTPNLSIHLRTLVRVSLMDKTTVSGTTRYTILSPIRLYSQQHLSSPPEWLTALMAYFANLIADHQEPWKSCDQLIILPEFRNIRSLLIANMSKETPYTDAAVYFTRWNTYTYAGACDTEVIRQAMQFTNNGSSQARAACYLELGSAQYWKGDHADAKISFAESLRLFEVVKDDVGRAKALHRIGEQYYHEGDTEDAEAAFSKALDLLDEGQNTIYRARLYEFMGRINTDRRRFGEAGVFFDKALALYTGIGHDRGQATIQADLGTLELAQDNLAAAESYFTSALALNEQIKHLTGEAYVHEKIGELQMRREDFDAAEVSFSTAIALRSQTQELVGQAYGHERIGELHMKRGNIEAAEISFSTSLALRGRTQDHSGQAYALSKIGDLHMRQDNLEAAETSFNTLLALHEKTQSFIGLAYAHSKIGELHMKRENLEAAEASFASAFGFREQSRNPNSQAYGHLQIGELHMKRGNLDAAGASFAASLALYVKIGDTPSQQFLRGCIRQLQRERARIVQDEDMRVHSSVVLQSSS